MKALKTGKTPTEFIEDIISVIGSEGTLLIPALSYRDVNAENPCFSAKKTEPCIGLIPGTFFFMLGVIRSLHPTHSVCAFGKRASELTSKHILDETPVGPHSPIMRIVDYNGKILFIGDVLRCCTFIHGIEELVGSSYCLEKERTHYIIEDENGNTGQKDMFAHDFVGWKQEYQRIKDILEYPDIKTGKVGQAECYLIDAAALLAKAKEKLRENQYYFVTAIREAG
jgi:aminoglycoside 3-N-acetyltransferase